MIGVPGGPDTEVVGFQGLLPGIGMLTPGATELFGGGRIPP